MKKNLSLLLVVVLIISLVFAISSCGETTGTDTDTTVDKESNTETESTETDTSTDTQTETETDDLTDTETETSTETETESDLDTESETDTDTDTETETEPEEKFFTVTFVQDGFANIVRTVKQGESLTSIPTPKKEIGYTVAWEDVDLTNIKSNIIVEAVKTPIEYKITYVLNGGFNNKDNPTTFTVMDDFVLFEPYKLSNATFLGWYTTESFDQGTKVTKITGLCGNLVLYANWLEYQVEEADGFEIDTTGSLPKLYKVVSNSVENIDLNQAIKVSHGCTWKMFRDFQGDYELKLKAMSLNVGENKAYVIVYHPDGEHWSRYEIVLYRLDMLEYAFYNGTSGIENGVIEEQSEIVALTKNPTKTGYTFKGWQVNGEAVSFPYVATKEALTNGSIVFEPIYEINTYSISYVLNGGENNLSNPSEYTIIDKKSLYYPTREHYNFVGWYENSDFSGSPVVQISKGEYGARIFYARWIPVVYDIEYKLNGGTNSTYNVDTYTTEEKVILEAPTRAGYTFVGWYADSEFENKVTMIEEGNGGNVTFYAKWEANENTLVFDANSGMGTMANITIKTDASAPLPANTFTKAGYTFVGWATSKDGNVVYNDGVSYTMGTNASYTLYAVWEANENTLVFDANSGTGTMANMTIKTDASAPLPANTFTKVGYTFVGWATSKGGNVVYNDGVSYTMGTNASYTLYAVWETIDYKISYILNGGTNNSSNPNKYTIEDKVTLASPSRDYYIFDGWYNDSGFNNKIEAIEVGTIGAKTLYARWTPIVYDIEYKLNGGTNSTYNVDTYTTEEKVVLEAPTRAGYTFVGWYADSEFENEVTMIEEGGGGSITFYAKWEAIDYKISYILNGGTNNSSNPNKYTIEDKVTLASPSRDYYIFDGWYNDSGFNNKIEAIEVGTIGAKTFYAKWIPVVYSITYELNGGIGNTNPMSYTVEDEIQLKAPTRVDYNFVGWYTDSGFNNKIEAIEVGTTGAKTLYAKWIPVVYSITYELNGGIGNTNPTSFTVEDEILLEPAFVLAGYRFDGWYYKGKPDVIVDKIEIGTVGNKILCAKITPVKYTITYELNGATGNSNPTTYTVKDEITLVSPTMIPTGYIFYGWYYENEPNTYITKIEKGSIGERTLCANISSVKYTITYILNSGTNSASNPNKYTVEDEISLKAPTREYYNFAGWYTDSGFNNKIEAIEVGMTGAKTLYAKWEPVKYTITYELNGITATTEFPSTYTVEDLPLALPNANGNREILWYTDDSFENRVEEINSLGNITLYAKLSGVVYYEYSTYVEVRDYDGTDTEVVIPSTFNGKPVTSIGSSAFYNCTSLTSITIPDSVTSIGSRAFDDCLSLTYNEYDNAYYLGNDDNPYVVLIKAKDTSITSCTINENTKVIYDSAFSGCTGLTSVTIGDSVTSIGERAFYDCTGLTSVTIGDSVTSIGDSAFEDCTGLTSITIPDSITSIGSCAFSGCTSLTSITIPDSITSIGYGAFQNCTGLTSITIPSSVTSIGDGAFFYCESLTSITIPDSVTSIGDYAFYDCTGLTSVTIGDSVTSIGNYAFHYCSSLTSITVDENNSSYKSIDGNLYTKDGKTLIQYAIGKQDTSFVIPDSVTSIGDYAFYGCTGLTSITIPDSVTSIGSSAFHYCSSLTSITIPDSVTSIGDGAFFFCLSLTSVTIPDSVTSIGDSAFYGCSGLTSITIPDSVTSIGDYAFEYCDSLSIYCEATSKPSGWDADWNSSNRPVEWGHTHSYTSGKCVCGVKEN